MERNNCEFAYIESFRGEEISSINNIDEYFESRKKKSYIFKYRRVSAGEISPKK